MTALSDILADTHPEWTIKATNLQEILEPIDPIYKVTDKLSAIRETIDEVKPKLSPLFQRLLETIAPKLTFKVLQSDQFYNEMLKRGVRNGLDILLPILQNFIRLSSSKIMALLKEHWLSSGNKPDLVISVIPNFNSVLYRSLKNTFPHVPYVTIMTDMVDIPPHFWMEDQDQIMICGTPKAFKQAVASGYYKPENIHQVSGMILKKYFYDSPQQHITLKSLGLSSAPRTKTALIMFGGNGSAISQRIVDQLNISDLDVQTIVMCGNNTELYKTLQEKDRCCPVPFRTDVTPYLRLADFFIGKPGPGSISEAVHVGCPVLVEGNTTTLPQERPNIDWIIENNVGTIVKDFTADIVDDTRRMIANLDTYRSHIAKLPENRAVFEIVEILEKIIENQTGSINENSLDPTLKKWRLNRLPIKAKNLRWKRGPRRSKSL